MMAIESFAENDNWRDLAGVFLWYQLTIYICGIAILMTSSYYRQYSLYGIRSSYRSCHASMEGDISVSVQATTPNREM